MARWECIVCGLIYDEVLGAPDDGIAPGTLWQDVPEDWLCPDCGVGKVDFQLLEEPEAQTQQANDAAPLIIIGTGLAGYNLVREYRKQDSDTPVIMITQDDGSNYSKPMLSTGYTKNKSASDLAMKDAASMASSFNIDIKTHTVVTNINSEAQTITICARENNQQIQQLNYSKLVLAWGASTITPPIKGDASDRVFSINDLEDYAKFRKNIEQTDAKNIVIIGGGLIGCEFTNDLLNGGFNITTIDPLAYCLPTLLPEAAGKAVQNALEAEGAKFYFGSLVSEVNQDGDQFKVSLDTGEILSADVVLSAVGVRPRLTLAQEAGIECERGIIANRLLETNKPYIYTLGDCAQVNGHVLFYVAPLMASSRALAKTLADTPTEVAYPAMPVTIKTPSCPVVVAPPERDAPGQWQIEQDGNNVKAEFISPDGELLGFALTGDKISAKNELTARLPAIFE